MAATRSRSRSRRLKIVLMTVILLVSVVYLLVLQKYLVIPKLWAGFDPVTSSTTPHPFSSSSTSRMSSPKCQNVLRDMFDGRWYRHEMTPGEILKMKLLYRRAREIKHSLPRGNEREDKRCGNLSVGDKFRNFRALCDEDGPTPCCYNFVCQNRTQQQCTCDNCLDMRSRIHAEYATWRPRKESCQPKQWSVKDICGLLENSTIRFIGDSLIRHMFLAFLLAARGNFETGALKSTTSEELRSECSGLNVYYEGVCRREIDKNATVCNGSVHLELIESQCYSKHDQTHEAVLALANTTRSLVFFGIGLHDALNFDPIKTQVLLPILQTMKSQRLTSPRLLWATVHQSGMMRSPSSNQNDSRILKYNHKVGQIMESYHVPVFDSYNLTHNVISYDGMHYGYGLNSVKANILLHYIQELKDQGKW